MSDRETSWIEVLNGDWSGPLKLRVRGRSMWPTLHPDDQVTVEPTTTDDLRPGDWVLLQGQEALFLHRFLGFTRDGLLLAKGDGHRAPDSPWPLDALRGRATAVSRRGKTVAISPHSLCERVRTIAHRLLAAAWTFLRRAGPALFLLLGVSATTAIAAVVLISFEATPQADYSVLITWETASETNMFGFYVQRAPYVTPEITACTKIPNLNRVSPLVPAEGDIVGAVYTYTDTSVAAGATYYYCLEAVENGGSFELHGPVSVAVPPRPTAPPPPPTSPPPPPPPVTPSPSPTPTPMPTPSTGTPPTSTPTRIPTRTPTQTTLPTPATQAPTAEPVLATTAPTSEPGMAASDAATAPAPASTPTPWATGSPATASLAQATPSPSITSGRPQPSPSPEPTLASLTRVTAKQEASFPWALILLLIVAASILILLGGWGIWRTRGKK